MQHLIRECFRGGGYVFATKALDIARAAGITEPARLASNENPFPASEMAISAAEEALLSVNRYPDERTASLTEALREYHGDYNFVTGVGMDGVIEATIRTLVEPGERVAISTPTFSFYGLAIRAQGATAIEIPRNPDFSVDVQNFIEMSRGARLSFLCSPNNPTGNATSVEDVRRILEGMDGVLFLDCAYVEFSGIDYRPLMKEYDNLIIGRTMSKVFSLAGLRVGYAFVPEWFYGAYCRAATPFTLNAVSSAGAAAALSDRQHQDDFIAHVSGWRERFMSEVKFPVSESDANFMLIDVAPHTGDEVVEALARKGVIVRSCTSFPGLGNHYIRVCVGLDHECERFIEGINSL